MNQIKWIAGIAVFFCVAWMFRYEPLPTQNSLQSIVVWDRWTHQQCVFTFAENRGLHCSIESFVGPKAAWQSDPIVQPRK